MTEQTAAALPPVVDRSQLIVYNHMWFDDAEWQCGGWPQSPTYSKWLDSPDVARLYGPTETP